MATADKLTYLNATKLLLRDAIRRAGHYLPDSATFRSYPYALLPDESSLSLDFVRGEYVARNWRDGTASRAGLSNIMTTTRASGGGYFDHLGVFQWAANNEPRIDHDPATVSTSTSSVTMASGSVTLAVSHLYPVGSYVRATHDGSNWMAGRVTASTGSSVTLWVDRVVGAGTYASWTVIRVRGLLVEESRTNLLLQSEDLMTAGWVGNVARTPAEDGWVKVCASTNGDIHSLYVSPPITTASRAVRTGSVELKRADYRYVMVSHDWAGRHHRSFAVFDLDQGTVYRTANIGDSTPATAGIKPAGGGGYRAWVTAATYATSGTFSVWLIRDVDKDINVPAWLGDGALGTLVRRPQLEIGAFPTSYIPTTTAQVTRSAEQCVVSNLTDWYNASEGTLAASASQPVIFASSRSVASLSLSLSNRITLYRTGGGALQINGYAVPNPGGLIGKAVAEESIPWKHAVAYGGTTLGYSVNGLSNPPVSTTVTPADYTSLSIGNAVVGWGEYLNGHIEFIEFHPRKLGGSEISRLTLPSGSLRNIAHRGDSVNAPENTIAAYSTGDAMSKFDWWECDVGLTADGHFVLMHDATVDRTTDGTGALSSLTLAQVRALDAGSWKGPQFAGEQVPTLAEFLAHCAAHGKGCYPELKSGVDAEKAAEFIAIVDANIPRSRVVVQSFSIATLQNIRAAAGDIELGYLFSTATTAIVDAIQALGQPYCALMSISGLTVAGKELLDSRGIPYDLWTLTTAVQKSKCSAFGARGVMSDFHIEVT